MSDTTGMCIRTTTITLDNHVTLQCMSVMNCYKNSCDNERKLGQCMVSSKRSTNSTVMKEHRLTMCVHSEEDNEGLKELAEQSAVRLQTQYSLMSSASLITQQESFRVSYRRARRVVEQISRGQHAASGGARRQYGSIMGTALWQDMTEGAESRQSGKQPNNIREKVAGQGISVYSKLQLKGEDCVGSRLGERRGAGLCVCGGCRGVGGLSLLLWMTVIMTGGDCITRVWARFWACVCEWQRQRRHLTMQFIAKWLCWVCSSTACWWFPPISV